MLGLVLPAVIIEQLLYLGFEEISPIFIRTLPKWPQSISKCVNM